MDVEIQPIAGADSVVTGFPGLGPVLIQGICRVINHSALRTTVKYISIELSGNTWGNGGTFTTDLSLIHGKRILYESSVPSSDLFLEPSGLLDLPFLFELQQDYASVLPPSLDTSNLLSLDCHTQYNLKTLLRCDLDTSNVVSSKIFRLPRYDIVELKQVLMKHRNASNGQSRDGQLKYSVLSPKAIVPGDSFSVDLNVTSTSHRVVNVSIALIESVRISGDSGFSQAEASNIVFSWESCSSGIQPSLSFIEKVVSTTTFCSMRAKLLLQRDLMAPEWHPGKMASYGTIVSPQIGINPTSVSGGVELTHKIVFTIQMEEETTPITFQAPVSVVPVTKVMLDRLLAQSETIVISSDSGIASFGKFLVDFKNGRISDVPEVQLSDEEALQRAIAMSMEDDIAKAIMESEELFNAQAPGMSEEEAIRLAIAASMGSSAESGIQLFLGGGSSQSLESNPHSQYAQRTSSIALQSLGSLEARKTYMLQCQGRPELPSQAPSLRKATADFKDVNPDEVSLKVGDLVAIVRVFNDQWAEGYNIKSGLSGRFPLSVLSEPFELPAAMSPRVRVPWVLEGDIKIAESRLDSLLSSGELSSRDYISQRKELMLRLVS
ncbi:hypothetical protein HDU67_008000 [Dinochytrium kinnereticum]|nr:hypothetical protein HDU67_008000 [Dinochytrium kinnereticum]